MKKFIIVIFSFLIIKVTRSQTVQEIKRDIYYDRYEGAKKKLVSKGILKPTVMNKKVVPNHAYEEGYDWRYLSAAQIL